MLLSVVKLGHRNFVVSDRIIAIVPPSSAPIRRFSKRAKKEGKLIDASNGNKTRSVVITDSNHVILSSIQTETLICRKIETMEELPK